MNQQELFDEFYKALEPIAANDGAALEKVDVRKNNETWKGISIRFGDDPIAPTIYPERYRKTAEIGIPVSSIAKSVYGIAAEEAERIRRERIQFPFNREQAENHLMCAIVGYENNKEMLKDLPYERLADLAVYVRWDYGNASAVLTNEGLSRLQMTKEEALAIGKQNMVSQAAFQSLEEIMRGSYRADGMEEWIIEDRMAMDPPSPFYILTTRDQHFGAALMALPETLKGVHEKLGEDFYILPSSVHEVLILKESDFPGPPEELKEMVATINREQVEPVDRLSDTVYRFDGKKLSIAGTEGMEREEGIASVLSHRHSR